jgi:hypothetical protein
MIASVEYYTQSSIALKSAHSSLLHKSVVSHTNTQTNEFIRVFSRFTVVHQGIKIKLKYPFTNPW